MSYSTLRESSLYNNFISDWIDKDFKKWFNDQFLLCDDVLELVEEELVIENEFVFNKQKRDSYKPPGVNKVDFDNTLWGRLISDPTVKDPDSRLGKVFRRRFRVPFDLFEYLVELTDTYNLFGHKLVSKLTIPDKFKVLAILRTLGRGECLDTIEELSGISKSTVQRSLHTWCSNFVKVLKPDFVYVPEGEELKRIMEVYNRLGLTGAVGSIDCTHIPWDRVPKELLPLYTGKEGYPTIVYEVIVDHNRKILFTTRGFPGSLNDKTICKYDAYVDGLRTGTLYKDVDFELEFEDGLKRRVNRVYLISDGGYPEEPIFMNPLGARWESDEVYWSEWVESVRKDVECTFGILKGRWRVLKNPISYQNQSDIDNIFNTCCILHNMLLKIDGLDRWEEGVMWETLEPDIGINELDDTVIETEVDEIQIPVHQIDNEIVEAIEEEAVVVVNPNQEINITTDRWTSDKLQIYKNNHSLFRSLLITHYGIRYRKGLIQWPSRMNNRYKRMLPLIDDGSYSDNKSIMRTNNSIRNKPKIDPASFNCLLRKGLSTLYRINKDGEWERLGYGLFTVQDIPANSKICYFFGDRKRKEEANPFYSICINSIISLDCYQNYLDGICMASLANSSRGAYIDKDIHRPAQSNCHLCVSGNSISLQTGKNKIKAGSEIIWFYNNSYIYPSQFE